MSQAVFERLTEQTSETPVRTVRRPWVNLYPLSQWENQEDGTRRRMVMLASPGFELTCHAWQVLFQQDGVEYTEIVPPQGAGKE